MFYRDFDRMMTVAVSADSTFRQEPPKVLFEGRYLHCCTGLAQYDVAADGQSFFMIQGGEAREIRVVRGWNIRH